MCVFLRCGRRIYDRGYAGIGGGRGVAILRLPWIGFQLSAGRASRSEADRSVGNIVGWRAVSRPGVERAAAPRAERNCELRVADSPPSYARASLKIRKRDRDRAERIRLAGGPKPSLRERAVALALKMGVVRTKELTDIGVPRCYLARMCDEGLLVKLGYGRYRAAVPKAA
jgi:hypothetical protein